MVVDLSKYINSSETILTFITSKVIGYYMIFGKVAGNEYDPPTSTNHQYLLNNVYTQIKMSEIIDSHPEAKQLILVAIGTNNQSMFSIMFFTSSSIVK